MWFVAGERQIIHMKSLRRTDLYFHMTVLAMTALIMACNAPAAPPIAAPTATTQPNPTAMPTPEPAPSPVAAIVQTPEAKSNADQPTILDTATIAQVGEPAPGFELTLFDGETLNLSDLEGKVVVLNFWASWCPPCRWEMPAFERIWQEYEDEGVVFVGVAVSDWEPDARAFAEQTGVTYPIGLDDSGEIARTYRPVSMPTTYFIDREGKVSRKLVSVANEAVLRLFIQGQLKESG